MKNLTLLILLSFFVEKSVAQDTIIKNNSEKILVKILEIYPNEVRYKKFTFLDGPTYIEMKSDINMIVYSNGIKEIFEQKQPEKKVLKITEDVDYFEQKKPEKEAVKVSEDTDYYSKTYATNGSSSKIETFGKKYKTQGKIINEKSMRIILLDTKDPKIIGLVNQAKRAQRRQFIWIAAIPLVQLALVAAANARPYDPITQTYGPRKNGVVAFSAICFAGSIACPIFSISQKKKKKSTTAAAIKLYNQKY